MIQEASSPTRAEIHERAEQLDDTIECGEKELRITAEDMQKIERLKKELNASLGGTAEGAREMESSVEGAREKTDGLLNEQDGELENATSENDGFRKETEERRDVSEANLGKLSEGGATIERQEAVKEILNAKDAVLRDIDFLQETVKQALDASERSGQTRAEIRQITGRRR